jgi:hypothetical protein
MSRFLARFFALVAYALSLPAAAQTNYTLTVEPVITHTTPYMNPFTMGTVNLNGMTTTEEFNGQEFMRPEASDLAGISGDDLIRE